jgi:hypothetical protein
MLPLASIRATFRGNGTMIRGFEGRRRLTIADVMILIAALAMAWLVLRQWPGPRSFGLPPALRRTPYTVSPALRAAAAAWRWTLWSGLLAAVATGTVLVLRVLPPRPRWPRLACRPGFTAALAASCAALAVFTPALAREHVDEATRRWTDGPGPLAHAVERTVADAPLSIGASVAAVWLVQRIGGRWHPERGTLDRAGRVLGCYWIVLGPLVEGLRLLIAYLP